MLFKQKNYWLVISILLLFSPSCKTKKENKQEKIPATIEEPRPGTDPVVDSLKQKLDDERARRRGNK